MWWTGALLSLCVGCGFYTLADNTVENEAKERFRHLARNAQFDISASIKAYTEVLRGTASHFQAASPEHMTRESFHRYVQGLDLAHNFPAVDSINFAAYFTDAERAAHEAQMRQLERIDHSYPSYQIKPAGHRREYAVLTMIEPLDQFANRYGFDLASLPKVADALFSARDSGSMSSSGQPIPLRRFPSDIGMGMRIPIYRNKQHYATVEERRAECIGSVGLGFNVQKLINGALGDMSEHEVRVILRDGGLVSTPLPSDRPGPMLFDSHVGMPLPAADASFALTLPIQFNGRLWQANFVSPRRVMYSRFDAYLPALAACVGFGASMLICALFLTLASSQRRALRMARAMTRELRDSQAKLQLSHHRLRRLAAHADQIKEAERKRIAREIHDDLGQNLLVLRIEVDILVARTAQRHPRLHARAQATLRQIDETIRSVRHIINDLRPTVLDLGLGAAVEWQVAQFRQRSGIDCELVEHGVDVSIDDHCATALFRVLQESLSNIYQHAHASMVRVELRRAAGMLRMSISDNGVGIRNDSRNKTGSFGLVGIEERISLLGGHCSILSNPDSGTTVAVSIPLHPRPDPAPRPSELIWGQI
ncbi:CHASE domain-containing protein [Pseudoduganella sp. UC29_106]|uniref:sensor histidine kinase n=1 Tax=Pseudoduganella sp. UC29_106 TaxID=3374553 RepID=UPI0037566817